MQQRHTRKRRIFPMTRYQVDVFRRDRDDNPLAIWIPDDVPPPAWVRDKKSLSEILWKWSTRLLSPKILSKKDLKIAEYEVPALSEFALIHVSFFRTATGLFNSARISFVGAARPRDASLVTLRVDSNMCADVAYNEKTEPLLGSCHWATVRALVATRAVAIFWQGITVAKTAAPDGRDGLAAKEEYANMLNEIAAPDKTLKRKRDD